ncbi:Pyruvate dehydrogenase E1 component subunit beta [subsurface metagenome]|nr:alpha-ketoacid dehydrogenase subunit beta [Clostridia bacterium]
MTKTITFLEAIKEAMREEMNRDPNVIQMGCDIGLHGGAFQVTKGLFNEFGSERIINTPISEGTIISCAIGAAITGLRPVAEIMFIDFSTLAMDQIVNQAAKLRYMTGGQVTIPLVIRFPEGSGYKATAAQHSQCLEAWYAHVPGLKVVLPSNPHNAKGLFKAAVRDNNPVIYIEHKTLYNIKGEVPDEEYIVPIGKSRLALEGSDITVVAYSYMVEVALNAAKKLSQENISVEIIDLLTVKPIDIEPVIKSVKKTGKVVVAHEACKTCGLGAEIVAQINELAFDYLDSPVIRVTSRDVPISFNNPEEKAATVSESELIQAVKNII